MKDDDKAQRIEVARNDLRQARVIDDPDAPAARALADGESRLRIDSFALTSNNVTYAAFGEAMKYWDFFPTGDPAWGCIPVWGFAEVAESRAEGVPVGARCYGYWPMGRYLVVRPAHVSKHGFTDGAAHRAALAAVYNQIQFCAADPGYRVDQEAQQALLRPLFITSFLIDDFLAEAQYFGAQQVLLSSASSKTAFGTAFCLSLRRGRARGTQVIGLTSAGNVDFCRSLGCYDAVRAYDALPMLARDTPSVYVDFAGTVALRHAVHEHFGDALRYSCSVGGTHWDALGSGRGLPGPRPTLFFAPAQVAKRVAPPPEGWGPAEFQARVARAWAAFMRPVNDRTAPWLRVRRASGTQATLQALRSLLDGQVDARDGLMLSL